MVKLFTIVLLGLSPVYGVTTYAQTKIDVAVSDVTLEELFEDLQARTEFIFFYNDAALDRDKKITLRLRKAKLSTILRKAFIGTDLTYVIDERQVIVKKSRVENPLITEFIAENIEWTVTGVVTDDSGQGLPGANVLEKGTLNGTATDVDGGFTIPVTDGKAVLVVSYIGFETQEIPVNDRATIDVILEVSNSDLEEIIVTGYSTQTKKDLTGSVASVSGEEITARGVANVSNALQGAVAGVSVTRSGTAPGSGNSIRIRGITTLQGNSEPLILVDDVPVTNINDVNPNEIESISVLKDAAAAAIYGSRAAAGVIIITTKRAKEGDFSLIYSGEYFINKPTELRGTVSAVPYMQMDNEKAWNDNGNDQNEFPLWPEALISDYTNLNAQNPDQYPNTNWRDLILKESSSGNRHNFIMTGGSSRVRTNAMLGYEYQNALYDNRDWTRYTARINNDIDISDKFGASLNLALRITNEDDIVVDPTVEAIASGPVYAAHWQDGRIAEGKSGANTFARVHEGGFSDTDDYLVYGKASLFYRPIEGLKLSLNVAPSFNFIEFKSFNNSIPFWAADDPNMIEAPGYIAFHNETQRTLIERRINNNSITSQALVNYHKSFGRHNIELVAGYEEFSAEFETLGVSGNEFLSNDFPFLNQAPVDKVFDESTQISENAYASYFGRVSYNLDNKYYLQGTLRRDGSSRFGEDYRWGSFPSVALGWIASNEGFLKDLNPVLSFLKLRVSYGSLGNDRLGNYLYQSVLQFSDALIANGADVEAVRAAAQRFLAVEDITWETTTTFNFGLDVNMFNDRLSLTADFFKKETSDMLLDLSIPSLSGYDDPTVNVGNMDTDGWELSVSWRDKIGELNYSASFNFFDSKSTIGDVRGKRLFESGETLLSERGSEFRSWYGYQSDGIFQTQAEVDASPVTSSVVGPGDIKYKDISGPEGVPDGVINELDRTILGGSLPRYQYGGTINLDYRGFDLGLVFQGVGKNNFYLNQTYVRPFIQTWHSPSTEYADSYWSVYNSPQENLNARYPRLSENAVSNNYRFSDYWLVSGAYFRIKNLTLGYTLPPNTLERIGINKLRVYVSGLDLFTADKLIEGVDPEQGNGYLITKSFLFGIRANF